MLKIFLFCLFLTGLAQAQVGEVLSINGGSSAFLIRNGQQIGLTPDLHLETGDKLNSSDSLVTILIYPKIQMSLVKGSELVLSSHFLEESSQKTTSVVGLLKGLVRILVTKDPGEVVDQKVDANDVTFAVRGTEYEVSVTDEDADLDVVEGQVEVSSPYVQTFVPEIVKKGEGFRFERKARKFARRAFRERNRENRFLKKEAIRQRWAERKQARALRKSQRLENREERRALKQERQSERRARKNRGR